MSEQTGESNIPRRDAVPAALAPYRRSPAYRDAGVERGAPLAERTFDWGVSMLLASDAVVGETAGPLGGVRARPEAGAAAALTGTHPSG